MSGESNAGLLRVRGEDHPRVTFIELFFDLVFVFAVTQLSHLLLDHLSVRGALQTLLLLIAIWWAWIYTAWITNWFNPDHPAVRLMLIGIMLVSLIMAAALPEAFADRGLLFAVAYTAIQVGRTSFAVLALGKEPALRLNFLRILAWFLLSGVLWIAGGVADGRSREVLWTVAVLVEAIAPIAGFATPGLGRSLVSDWMIAGGHLAERCGLFMIVALGESILVTGATFADHEITSGTVAALLLAFAGSVALWWIYFDRSAGWADAIIAAAPDPGRLGRSAYTYFHLPMVAGIIVTAVGDELTIAHPGGHGDTALTAVALGGPALFLAGYALFKRSVSGSVHAVFVIAIGALALLVPLSLRVSPLVTSAASTLVVVAVAAWATHLRLSTTPAPAGVPGDEILHGSPPR
jgi:low temperature requirement protein LtrA